MRPLFSFLLIVLFMNCSSADEAIIDQVKEESFYFPPISGSKWDTLNPEELNWDTEALNELKAFLVESNTEAFIVLKDGKIAMEAYYNDAKASTFFPWNSAGKTLTAFTVGIAAQQNLLSPDDKTTTYLGHNWTNMTAEQEDAITIKNQLTMTSGGNYTDGNTACYDPNCLKYLNPAGTEWYYYNAYYTLLQPVLEAATPEGFKAFFETELKSKIGLDGQWVTLNYNEVYFSTARSMARFGLLNLNKGVWDANELLNRSYWTAMTNTSQDLNPSYGYLWWLNGKSSYKLPGATQSFTGKLIPNAPDDLIAGLGANDKKMYVIPSKNMVIVRLGPAANEEDLGPTNYDNDLWRKLNEVL